MTSASESLGRARRTICSQRTLRLCARRPALSHLPAEAHLIIHMRKFRCILWGLRSPRRRIFTPSFRAAFLLGCCRYRSCRAFSSKWLAFHRSTDLRSPRRANSGAHPVPPARLRCPSRNPIRTGDLLVLSGLQPARFEGCRLPGQSTSTRIPSRPLFRTRPATLLGTTRAATSTTRAATT